MQDSKLAMLEETAKLTLKFQAQDGCMYVFFTKVPLQKLVQNYLQCYQKLALYTMGSDYSTV